MESILPQISLVISNLLANFDSYLAPSAKQVGLIAIGIFIFLLLFAWTRHHMLEWSLKGAYFGIFLGIILTLILETILLMGGKTLIATAVRNEKTPQIVRTFLQKNMMELAQSLTGEPKTLGAAGEQTVSPNEVVNSFSLLSPNDQSRVQQRICAP